MAFIVAEHPQGGEGGRGPGRGVPILMGGGAVRRTAPARGRVGAPATMGRSSALDLLRGALIFSMVAVHGAFAGALAVGYPEVLAALERVGVAAFAVVSGVGYGFAARWGRRPWHHLSATALLLIAHVAYVALLGPLLPGTSGGATRYALVPGIVALGAPNYVAEARLWYPGPLWPIAVVPVGIALLAGGSGWGGRARLALAGMALLALGAVPGVWGGGLLLGEVGTPLIPFAGAGLLGAWLGGRLHGGVDRRALASPLRLGIALLIAGGAMAAFGSGAGTAIAATGGALATIALAMATLDRPAHAPRTNRATDAPERRPPGLPWRRLGRVALGVVLLHATLTEAAAAALRSVAPGFDAVPWAAAAFGLGLAGAVLGVAQLLPPRLRAWGALPRAWRPRAGPPQD